MAKEICFAWPILCKIELQNAIGKLKAVLERLNFRDEKDSLVLAMKSAIIEGERALNELDQAYGK